MILVREETPDDMPAIGAVNRAAFGGLDEAKLVERLRTDGDLVLSLVAQQSGEVIGHCGFSRHRIDSGGDVRYPAAFAAL